MVTDPWIVCVVHGDGVARRAAASDLHVLAETDWERSVSQLE